MYFYPRKKKRFYSDVHYTHWKRGKAYRLLRKIFKRAKEMRDNPTPSEAKANELIYSIKTPHKEWKPQWVPEEIWLAHVKGYPSSERCPYYILDFYCPDLKLAVEIDGSIHEDCVQVDKQRDYNLKKIGITTIRFPDYVVTETPEHFIEQLTNIMTILEDRNEAPTKPK